ncbi:cytochrome o ubiquinol oxidase, subunit I, partial [Streptomyces azureus]
MLAIGSGEDLVVAHVPFVSGTFPIVTPVSVILVASGKCDVRAGRGHRRGMRHLKWLTTTDHKTIGTLYLVTSFAFFVIGGVMA